MRQRLQVVSSNECSIPTTKSWLWTQGLQQLTLCPTRWAHMTGSCQWRVSRVKHYFQVEGRKPVSFLMLFFPSYFSSVQIYQPWECCVEWRWWSQRTEGAWCFKHCLENTLCLSGTLILVFTWTRNKILLTSGLLYMLRVCLSQECYFHWSRDTQQLEVHELLV